MTHVPFITNFGEDFILSDSSQLYVVGSDSPTPPTPTPFDFTLYQNTADQMQVNKTAYLTAVGTLQGALRQGTSIVRPKILVQITTLPQFNYCYIPIFERYYHVVNIVSMRYALWEIELNCDVLMSYMTQIYALQGVIARQEYSYDDMIVDTERPRKSSDTNTFIGFTDLTSPYPFSTAVGAYRYVLSSVTNTTGYTPALGGAYYQRSFISNTKLLLDDDVMRQLIGVITDTPFATALTNVFANQPLETVLSIRAYPFDVFDVMGVTGSKSNRIYLSSYDTGIDGAALASADLDYLNFIELGSLTTRATSFEDFVSDYSLYVPFYGFVDLPSSEIVDRKITLRYYPDFDTGIATVNIYSTTVDDVGIGQIIKVVTCQLGVDIPLSQSNAQDQLRSLITIGTNLAVGAVTGGVGLALGASSALGALSGATPHFSRGGSQGGAWTALNWLTPYLIKSTPDYITPADFGHYRGFPSMQTATLSTLSGYTRLDRVHVEGLAKATQDEKAEVERLLLSGVIL